MKKKTGIRILSFLMTAILVAMCFGTALAAEGDPSAENNYNNGYVTFEIPEKLDNHSFAAYQIFSCVVDNGSMTNVEWGSGITPATFLSYLSDHGTGEYNETMTAAQCAAAIQTVYAAPGADQARVKALILAAAQEAKADTPTKTFDAETTLPRGYYLIEDTTDVQGEDMEANYAVLTYTNTNGSTTNTGSFQAKTDKPTVEKKVREDDKYKTDDGYGTGFNDVADANIGQTVDFLLVGTIPNMANYATYKTYTFEDTLSEGLTAISGISVWLSDNKTKSDGDDSISGYFDITAPTAANGNKLTVALKSGQDLKDIPNIASAKYILVTYQAKLNNKAVIGVNGNPNWVNLTYSNNPNWNGEGDEPTGKTPDDKVIVFTYEIDAKKVDSTNSATTLTGAKFYLYRMVDGSEDYAVLTTTADGDYKVSSWTSTKASATEIVTVAGGLAKIAGLDDGTYFLYEKEAPAGYAPLVNPIQIDVKAGTVHTQEWDGTNNNDVIKNVNQTTVNATTGKVDVTIQNSPIGILPETGGMGTTLFTLGGLVLMMAAAMLFVLRRRKEV